MKYRDAFLVDNSLPAYFRKVSFIAYVEFHTSIRHNIFAFWSTATVNITQNHSKNTHE